MTYPVTAFVLAPVRTCIYGIRVSASLVEENKNGRSLSKQGKEGDDPMTKALLQVSSAFTVLS